MFRVPWLRQQLLAACVRAWWDAWDAFWSFFADQHDPNYQRDQRSQDRNTDVHDLDVGGNFYAAGSGSDAD